MDQNRQNFVLISVDVNDYDNSVVVTIFQMEIMLKNFFTMNGNLAESPKFSFGTKYRQHLINVS